MRFLVFALLSCAPAAQRLDAEGWTLSPPSLPAPGGWQEALALDAPWCEVPLHRWGGVVTFVAPGAFETTADVPTWYPGDVPRIGADSVPALRHGACHIAQMVCGVDPYEHDGRFRACLDS